MTRPILAAVTALVLAASFGVLRAQDQSVFRSRTELVTVTATVTDRSSRRVTGLRQGDFTVLEEGVRQEIAFFTAGDDTPTSIGVVVDVSGSMVDKIDDVRDALIHFIATLRPDDEVFMTSFAERAAVEVEFTRDAERLRRAVRSLRANGGTALYDAVIDGVDRLAQGTHPKKALLIISDGIDTNSAASRRDAERAVVRSESLVYAFGIGHGSRGSFGHEVFGGHGGLGGLGGRRAPQNDAVDLGLLRDFAEPTGGRAYLLEEAHRDGRDLVDEAVAEVASELRQQYTLGYYPINPAPDGKFRRVQVRVSKPDARVRAREGYWARSEQARP